MERRSFLSISAVGAIGAGYTFKAAASIYSDTSQSKLSDFWRLTEARRCHFLAVDKKLEELGTATAASWLALGYQTLGASAFWMAGADTALLPLQLRHSTEGILDTQVLVFSRSQAGSWQATGSLSGFHLEAIAQAASSQQMNADTLKSLVLPVIGQGQPFSKGWSHPTQAGHFGLSVQIATHQTRVEAVLTKEGKIVWQSVFPSAHLLPSAAFLPA